METNIRNKCKAYTSLEQSKKLAEILPPESADMYYAHDSVFDELESIPTITEEDDHFELFPNDVGCWSLVALLNYLREIDFFPNIEADEHSVIMSISYYDEKEARPLAPINSIKVEADVFVDACYEMILKLHELNLL